MNKNVLILMGGKSCEHDISLLTASQVIANLDKTKYNLFFVYITKKQDWLFFKKFTTIKYLQNTKNIVKAVLMSNNNNLYVTKNKWLKQVAQIDVAINCMHGKNCEDGSIFAILNNSNIPCISSDILQSSIGLDKSVFKQICEHLKLNTTKAVVLQSEQFYKNIDANVSDIISKLNLPVIIKPCNLGSSIGIEICKSTEQLESLIEKCFKYDNKIIIEELLQDIKEVNIAIYKTKDRLITSLTEQPITKSDILSFSDKYLNQDNSMAGLTKECPAKISKTQNDTIIKYASTLYNHLNMKGVVRFDFMINKMNKKVYINEVNTIPGSFAYYLFEKSFTEQLDEQIEYAMFEYNYNRQLITSFESNLLNNNDCSKFSKMSK